MLPVLQIGPVAVRAPELALLAGLWLGLEIASRAGKRHGLDPDRIYSIGFWSTLGGAVAARAAFVWMNLSIYQQIQPVSRALLSAISLSPGTEIEWIGLLVALLIAAALTRRWKLPALRLADAFSPGLAAMAAAVSFANLLSGEAYGIETSLPWGISLWGAQRHPIQIYFALAFIGILVVLWRWQDRPNPAGMLCQWFLIFSGMTILLIEPLRADSPLVLNDIRAPQVIALVLVLAAMGGFALRAPSRAEVSPP